MHIGNKQLTKLLEVDIVIFLKVVILIQQMPIPFLQSIYHVANYSIIIKIVNQLQQLPKFSEGNISNFKRSKVNFSDILIDANYNCWRPKYSEGKAYVENATVQKFWQLIYLCQSIAANFSSTLVIDVGLSIKCYDKGQ